MKITEKTTTEKEAIIAEYLLGEKSYRHLGLGITTITLREFMRQLKY